MTKKSPKIMTLVFVSLLVLIFLAAVPCSQAADKEKKEDIKVYQKFYKVTNAEGQYNQIINIMATQFQQGFIAGFREAAKKMENATPEQQTKFRELFQKAMESYTQKMKKKAAEVMPLNDLINNIYYPVLAQHFTEAEVQEMIKFYESPVGQKYISTAPTIMQETSVLINQKYMPELKKISAKVADEEMKKIKPELEKLQKK
jgi:hypothetical protein